MKTIDLSKKGNSISSYLFKLKQQGELEEPFRLLVNPKEDLGFWMNKDTFVGYDVIFNEYEGGLYLGDEALPYRFLIGPKDDEVTEVSVHPTCVLICKSAFKGHPSLRRLTIAAEEPININSNAFSECPKLESVAFDCKKEVTIRFEAFQKNPLLSRVTFDDVATYIFNSNAFAECPSISEIELPLGLINCPTHSYSREVFHGTPLKHVYLHERINYIQRWFDKDTMVYCALDPQKIYTDFKEETVEEPYYDYYHPGGTAIYTHDLVGGENFIGPLTYKEYRQRIKEG